MTIKTLIEIYNEEVTRLNDLIVENPDSISHNIIIKIEARIEVFQEVIQDLKNIS